MHYGDFSQAIPSLTGQYRAEYYNNLSLSGSPIFTRNEGSINYDWGSGGPGNGVGNDNFSARWTGHFNFSAGSYTIIARADDGIRVWVDDSSIIDAWRDQPATEYRANCTLSDGEHEVKVEYYEKGGQAVAQLRWEANTYYLKGIAQTDHGGLTISKELFPEGEGKVIPIFVPDVTNDSNAMIEDSTWRALRTIETSRGDFDWRAFFSGLASNTEESPGNEYVSAPKSAVFSLISAGLLSAEQASSKTKLKVTIQKNPKENLRAIVQIADSEINTSMRYFAGKGWQLGVLNAPGLHSEYISKNLYTAFRLEPDACYAPGIQIDSSHRYDEYIGYISFIQDNKLIFTPKIYPDDGFKVVRGKAIILGILIMPRDVFELRGDGYLSLFESPLGGEAAVRVSKLLDASRVTLLSEH